MRSRSQWAITSRLAVSQVASLVNVGSSVLNSGQPTKRWGTAHASIVPYQAFDFADGEMVVSATYDEQWKKLATCIGKPEMGEDPK